MNRPPEAGTGGVSLMTNDGRLRRIMSGEGIFVTEGTDGSLTITASNGSSARYHSNDSSRGDYSLTPQQLVDRVVPLVMNEVRKDRTHGVPGGKHAIKTTNEAEAVVLDLFRNLQAQVQAQAQATAQTDIDALKLELAEARKTDAALRKRIEQCKGEVQRAQDTAKEQQRVLDEWNCENMGDWTPERVRAVEGSLRQSLARIDREQQRREAGARLTPETECTICKENRSDAVLVPCGHGSFCMKCGEKLKDCPLCRAKVKACVRVIK